MNSTSRSIRNEPAAGDDGRMKPVRNCDGWGQSQPSRYVTRGRAKSEFGQWFNAGDWSLGGRKVLHETCSTLSPKGQRVTFGTRSICKMLGPFATASRRTPLFYIAIHQLSLLSHAACAIAIAIAIDVHNNDDNNDNA